MAEERILDDDIEKDKKYRIIKGEDGEEELVINEVEEPEELSLDVPDEFVEDEDIVLTPEQYEAARLLKEQEEERVRRELEECVAKARGCVESGRYSDALDCVALAAEIDGGDIATRGIKLEALTQKFTDFSSTKEVTKTCKALADVPEEETTRLREAYGASTVGKLKEAKGRLEDINARYAAEQGARREILAPRRKKATINFCIVLAVFAVFLAAALVCSTMMFSRQDGLMLAVTIVLAVIALAAFVALVIFARAFVGALRMYAANESDYSTKLGRERAELNAYRETLEAVCTALGCEL